MSEFGVYFLNGNNGYYKRVIHMAETEGMIVMHAGMSELSRGKKKITATMKVDKSLLTKLTEGEK